MLSFIKLVSGRVAQPMPNKNIKGETTGLTEKSIFCKTPFSTIFSRASLFWLLVNHRSLYALKIILFKKLACPQLGTIKICIDGEKCKTHEICLHSSYGGYFDNPVSMHCPKNRAGREYLWRQMWQPVSNRGSICR